MSEDLNVQIDDSQFRNYMEKRKDLKPLIARILQRIGVRGERIMAKHAPANRGFLRSRINAQMEDATTMSIAPRDVPYADIPITGTFPFTPPLDPILRWSRRHGLEGGAVWQSIRQTGIESAEQSAHRVDYVEETVEELGRHTDRIVEDTVQQWIRGAIR